MKISELWLREWVSPKLDTVGLAERLTMAGLEVGGVAPVSGRLDKVVVGEIMALSPHPDADRLRVAKVGVGKKSPLTIVCGAPNAAVGMKAPVAMTGATLPGGLTIKQSKVRGVESAGMLCSAAELGLEESAAGLLPLPATAVPGMTISELLQLDDNVIEVDLTPNRSDCLSISGIAREVAALTGARLRHPKIAPVRATSRRQPQIVLKAPQDCPRYVGRIIEDIDPQAQTPLWMQERLRRSDIRSLGPVVDVTNYVLLELGQPMHAFDLDRIEGGIQVRRARANEAITLLDGNEVKLEAGALLIADAKHPLALAGIMGGLSSAVTDTTRHILLESAYFAPRAITGRARQLGLHTESSHRFERGVDPALQRQAIERATQLLLEIVGGQAGPVVEVHDKRHLPKRKAVTLRQAALERLLGIVIPPARIITILKRLGMQVSATGRGWRATPPSWRFDIEREVDLIEEVARVYGYDQIPAVPPLAGLTVSPLPENPTILSRLRTVLVDRDYQEVITYSFVDPVLQAQVDPLVEPMVLANPIASDMAAMRTTLWPGVLQTIQYNQNRQQPRVRVFEAGRRFLPAGQDITQDLVLAGGACGLAMAEQWGVGERGRTVDFFDIKGDVEALLQLAGIGGDCRFEPAGHPALHPGQSAEIRYHNRRIGLIGALHPDLQGKLSLDRQAFLFEVEISPLQAAKIPEFREISRFPAIRRDLALVLDRQTPAQAVLDIISNVAGNLLVNLELFDEYRGEGIDSGRKSLALGLTLQDSSRTLKEDEIETLINRVIIALQSKLGAQLRM